MVAYKCSRFLGNEKTETYEDLVTGVVKCVHAIGCNMPLKLHFLDFFAQNLGSTIDELGVQFNQGHLIVLEKHSSGQWNESMLAAHFWYIISDTLTDTHKRKRSNKSFVSVSYKTVRDGPSWFSDMGQAPFFIQNHVISSEGQKQSSNLLYSDHLDDYFYIRYLACHGMFSIILQSTYKRLPAVCSESLYII